MSCLIVKEPVGTFNKEETLGADRVLVVTCTQEARLAEGGGEEQQLHHHTSCCAHPGLGSSGH